MITIELFESYGARHADSGVEIDLKNRQSPKDPIGPLCRKLRELGYDEDERVHIIRNGKPVFKRDRKLSAWARYDVIDRQTQSATLNKFVPFSQRSSQKQPSSDLDE